MRQCLPMDYKIEIGRRIAAERDRCGWSLDELARRTNGFLSKSRISNYEQGTRMPGPKEISILAAALGCDAAYLMCLSQSFTKQELDLLRNFRALPEKDRNDYQRRISILALAYKEPLPDENLPDEYRSLNKNKKEKAK